MAALARSEIRRAVDMLVRARRKCQPVLVLAGAGISIPEGIPGMGEILKRAVRVFNQRKYADDPVLEDHPELLELEGLQRVFREDPDPLVGQSRAWKEGIEENLRSKETAANPGPQHQALAELLSRNLVRAVLTTNWDTLLERSTRIPAGDQQLTANLISDQGYVIVREPGFLRQWLGRPRAAPALMKLHGDVLEQRCENDHVTVMDSSGKPSAGCPNCGDKVERRLLLPDSARRLSREMIRQLQEEEGALRERRFTGERLSFVGCILVVGFSFLYDQHIQELIEFHLKQGCDLIYLDTNAEPIFGMGELLLRGSARTILPALAGEWIDAMDNRRSDLDAQGVDLEFVREEERFDALFGRVPITDWEARILAHPEFERLRHIRQLGRKQRFYPSADHSRFEHTVATLSVVDDLYLGLADAVQRAREEYPPALAGYAPNSDERQLVRLATLFHDFGHIWFSHLGEDVLEDMGQTQDSNEDVPRVLQRFLANTGMGHEGRVREFLAASKGGKDRLLKTVEAALKDCGTRLGITLDDFFALLAGASRLGHLNPLVASNLDADKLEYLSRDANRTGKGGSRLSPQLVGQALDVTEFGRTTVRLESVDIVERVASERYLMFQSVYHDDRVRAIEASLADVLTEYLAAVLPKMEYGTLLSTLLEDENELLKVVRQVALDRESMELSNGKEPTQALYWQKVLDLTEGTGAFPILDRWLIRPGPHIRELPLEDAGKYLDDVIGRFRDTLGDVFWTRYRHRAVFSLTRFRIHSGVEEIPISGQNALFSPADVSPLIQGLQDVRQSIIRLGVLYFVRGIKPGCSEEIERLLVDYENDLEVAVRHLSR